MKILKWFGIILAAYIALVVVFETLFLGLLQPKLEASGLPMLVITTVDESGESRDRRLARFELDRNIYVSAHHWPRGWYEQAIEEPNVRAEIDGEVADYRAVPVSRAEFDRVEARYPIPLSFKILMGFPPQRDLLRLDSGD